ncbi:TPA: hypothetical protein N2D16_002708 [Clostridium botulinum]|nr:hypothetical protein [Clostridium botulinum]HCL4455082.1 hypothetical protein [Clostridium botulinum]
MKKYKWGYIAYGMMWLATSIAVSAAIFITKSATPLWAMFIPSFVSIESGKIK